jgi:trans-aconitate methyltransferase
MNQRLNEWIENSPNTYHEKQFKTTYRSTIKFCDWLNKLGYLKNNKENILDVGCGMGANIYYMAKRFKNNSFYGMDINGKIIQKGNKILENKKIYNAILFKNDIYNPFIHPLRYIDGIISFQTLSWLPEYEIALKNIIETNKCSNWLAFTSLFYEGNVSYKIEIREHNKNNRTSFYNIYSIPKIKEYLKSFGYTNFHYKKFEIDINLKQPKSKEQSSYTKTLKNNERLLFSGSLYLPWYFIAANK